MDFLQYQSQYSVISAFQIIRSEIGTKKTYTSQYGEFIITIDRSQRSNFEMFVIVDSDGFEIYCDSANQGDWLVIINIDEVMLVPNSIFEKLFYI